MKVCTPENIVITIISNNRQTTEHFLNFVSNVYKSTSIDTSTVTSTDQCFYEFFVLIGQFRNTFLSISCRPYLKMAIICSFDIKLDICLFCI